MVSVDRYCRTCLRELNDLVESLRKHYISSEIADKLVCCTMISVELNDEFPKHLCDCCLDQLEKFNAFRIMCHESVARFREILSTTTNFKIIKSEEDITIEEIPVAEAHLDIVKNEVPYLENSPSLVEIEIQDFSFQKVEPFENPLDIQIKTKRNRKRPPAILKSKKGGLISSKSVIKEKNKMSVDRLKRSKPAVERESEHQLRQKNDEHLASHPETEINVLSTQKVNRFANPLEIQNTRNHSQNRLPAKVKIKKSDLISSKSVIKGEKDTRVDRLQRSKPVIETASEDQLQQKNDENLTSLPESEVNEISSEIIDCSPNFLTINNKRKQDRKRTPAKVKNKKDGKFSSKSVRSEEKQTTVEVESGDQLQQRDSSKSSKVFQCKVCSKHFFAEHTFTAHRRKHDGLSPYPCPHADCGRGFGRLQALQYHLEQHEGTVNLIRCEEPGCNHQYKRKHGLIFHLRKHHKKGPELNSYVCEVCGKIFKSPGSLSFHRYVHKDKSELPHACSEPDCKRRFSKKDKLQEHMMRHAGIKNFVCSVCGAPKTTKAELRVHMNYHTLEHQHPCQFCSQIFNNGGNLKRHVRTVHEGAKDFPCRHCDRTFGKRETRKHHEMTHTGEKPHECSVCGKRFIQPTALRTHQKTHLRQKTNSGRLSQKKMHIEEN